MALNLTVKLHPVVLLQIVDAYERRNHDTARVIGTLLGTSDKTGIEVTNCFCVPHTESHDEVAVELDFAKDMFELHRKVNPQEVIVGWWATGNSVTSHSVLIHEYYSRECNNPIHVTVDTSLENLRMGVKAYVSIPMGISGKTLGCMFAPRPVEVVCYDPEVVGLLSCQKTKSNPKRQTSTASELAQIVEASQQMESMLDAIISYVDDIIAGKVVGDNAIGRSLLDMVHAVPKMSEEEFAEMLNSNRKDLLMVLYLSQLAKTQLTLNEKLTLLAV
uniref:Eukaryotic translation initiation factor 3 subunit F n=1 Tax=Lynceus sp. MCZ IZ 141354 TaxID=1930659 RepID=A0A9N6WSX0_9CRUS|nr:EOG090X09C5 [Lynceus sp. MCZ IZ 141354]